MEEQEKKQKEEQPENTQQEEKQKEEKPENTQQEEKQIKTEQSEKEKPKETKIKQPENTQQEEKIEQKKDNKFIRFLDKVGHVLNRIAHNVIESPFIQVTLVIICIAVTFFAIYYYSFNLAMQKSDSLRNQISARMSIIDSTDWRGEPCKMLIDSLEHNNIIIAPKLLEQNEFNRLLGQLSVIRIRYQAHGDTIDFLYSLYFMFNVLQAVMALLMTTIGLIISRTGWEKVKRITMVTFFIFGGILVFIQVLSTSLKLDDNLRDNKVVYYQYKNMENEIFTYLATGKNRDLTSYLYEIDAKLMKFHKIAFELDKVDTKGFSDELMKSSESSFKKDSK